MTFNHAKLMKWIANDPYREATLIEKVPVKQSTLLRIKNGTYKPSALLGSAIMNEIKKRKKK